VDVEVTNMGPYNTSVEEKPKPVVQLTGTDGNVFSIIGACTQAARRAGWTVAEVSGLRERLMGAGSYDGVLQQAMRELDVQ
jgi:hypothetical protein